jgi:hypothetical protein
MNRRGFLGVLITAPVAAVAAVAAAKTEFHDEETPVMYGFAPAPKLTVERYIWKTVELGPPAVSGILNREQFYRELSDGLNKVFARDFDHHMAASWLK